MNRIQTLFQQKPQDILSVFFTAGYPNLADTVPIIEGLAAAGVDLIEIGMPYSDPIADGETIQKSSMAALANGMTISHLFEQLSDIRQKVEVPLLLMGYLNPALQFGLDRFLAEAARVGVDGLIIPDLPIYEYHNMYQPVFQQHGLSNIFLITPQTSAERIQQIDALSEGFIYMVSTDSTTGKTEGFGAKQLAYFERINQMKLANPRLIGFGISDHTSFNAACNHAAGAIIGSAFIKSIGQPGTLATQIDQFVSRIRQPYSISPSS